MGDAADLIKGEMQKLVPPSQRALVRNSGGFPLGAQMSQPTHLQNPTYDIALRDRLFNEWQSLLKIQGCVTASAQSSWSNN
jgi:hypothetical protein